jgi:hypothetical protein
MQTSLSTAVPNPGYKDWTVTSTFNTETQKITTTVYGASGSVVATGTPEVVKSHFTKIAGENPDEAKFYDSVMAAASTQAKTFSDNIPKTADQKTAANAASTGGNKADDDGRLAGNKFAESTKTTKGDTASKINGPGKRTWNPLGDFSSYTYRISLYALSPDAFNSYKKSGQWDRTQLSLICQSGGASTDNKLDASRGKGFELDYYIDDLEIVSNINAKEVGIATNSLSFKFKIREPYGLTFPTRLIELQKDLKAKSKIKSPATTFIEAQNGIFMLSIRFYGYDESGNVVTSAKYNNGSFDKNLDESATFERSFTIFLTKMNFKLEGKGAVYDIDCRVFDQQIGNGVKRSVLDQPPKAMGSTVKETIGGSGGTTTGLLDILNQQQQEFKNKKLCEIADVYAVEYEKTSKIKDARMVDSNDVNKTRVGMTAVKKVSGSNARSEASPAADSFKVNRTIQFSKGATILTAIDQIITQSSYVEDALTELDKEEPQSVQEGQPLADNNANPKVLQWYMINPNVEILGYDKIRKDFAYKITYVVQSYDVPYVQSANIKQVPKYPGPNKIYNYFYTGKNSEVLSYDQTYNNLFFLYSKMSSAGYVDNGEIVSVPVQPKPSNNADPVGKPSGKDEGAASIKTFLYSPQDQAHAKIKILGDPDFLMPVTSGTVGQMLEKWYGPDLTINPNSGQVFIEVLFNQVEDYEHPNGLLTPNGNIETNGFNQTAGTSILNNVVKGTVFMVLRVISKFSQGKFTQEFDTKLPPNFKSLADTYNRTGTADKDYKDASSTREKKTDPKKEPPKTAKQALEQLKSSVRIKPTANDDQILAPLGTFANAGRELTGVNPITGAKSIMFKK